MRPQPDAPLTLRQWLVESKAKSPPATFSPQQIHRIDDQLPPAATGGPNGIGNDPIMTAPRCGC